MKLKNSYFLTYREDSKDEDSNSGRLLVKSGMIKKSSNGVYIYLPLGYKVLRNIEGIVRDKMNEAGAQELLMPALIPEDVYVSSGRREKFGPDMFTLSDRYNRKYALGPTHEELFTGVAKDKIKSYKDMPFNLYQIETKFRDEPRPRFGLIRVREFIMKDAYSFDRDAEGLDKSYKIMGDAYHKIFDAVGLDYKVVKASVGLMGATLSEEFQAVTPIGEDTLVLCEKGDYASNLEVSSAISSMKPSKELSHPKELVHTPKAGTIKEISHFLGEDPSKFVKTLIYEADNKFYACLVAGNRDINEGKLQEVLGAQQLKLADPKDVEDVTNAKVGFAGPIDIDVPIIMDDEIKNMRNFIVGANKTDYHYKNVNLNDFVPDKVADIKNVIEGDLCPKCGRPLYFNKGIEVGNIFKLDTHYSEVLNLTYLDENNKPNLVWMGSYGIGLGRVMAAIAEQYSDEHGIAWPLSVAPYKVALIQVSDSKEATDLANSIYNDLMELGVEPLFDNRDVRAGVKFNDMDLIGIPLQIVVGKKAQDGVVEFKERCSQVVKEYNEGEVIEKITEIVL